MLSFFHKNEKSWKCRKEYFFDIKIFEKKNVYWAYSAGERIYIIFIIIVIIIIFCTIIIIIIFIIINIIIIIIIIVIIIIIIVIVINIIIIVIIIFIFIIKQGKTTSQGEEAKRSFIGDGASFHSGVD